MTEPTITECCHDECDPQIIREEFEAGPADERVKVVAENVPVGVCRRCKEVVYGAEAAEVRHRAIIAALGCLAPEEIKVLRERFGMALEEFAKLTGIDANTLSKWERGRLIQPRAMDNYLRLLAHAPDAVDIVRGKGGTRAVA